MTDGFGKKARSAVIWNTGFNLFRDLLQFGSMLVLVRLLQPDSYGEFAMVTSIIGFLSIFSHNNFIAHLLQVKDEEDALYQEHFTASALLQIGIFLITNVVAMILHSKPTYAPITLYIHVMSITSLLEWPCELRRKMIERQFNWRRPRLLQAIGLIGGVILALVMAWAGAGTYALLIPGMLVTLPFIYDLFVIEKWRPTWSWTWDDYRTAWHFGLTRLGSGIASTGRQLVESGVLTAVVGFATLGIFNRSIGLAQMFCQKFASQLLYAIYPILTRLDGRDGNSTRVGGLVLRLVVWTVVPIAVVFAELSEPVVRVIYGQDWSEVTPLLPWAMAWGALVAISHAVYMLLLSKNKTRLCLYGDIGIFFGTGLTLWFVLPHGLVTYLAASGVLQLLLIGVLLTWLKQLSAISFSGIINAFVPPAIGALLAWALLHFLVIGVPGQTAQSFTSALAWGAAFMLLYLILLRLGFSKIMAELIQYFPANKRIRKLLILNTHT